MCLRNHQREIDREIRPLSRATRSRAGGPPPDRAQPGAVSPRVESMPIERLSARLDAFWDHRLALVVAPPGSGKTTLMERFVAGVEAPVAWLRCDRWDTTPAALVTQLATALEPWTEGRSAAWTSIDALLVGLSQWDPERALLIVDDLHELDGSPAEAAMERLLDHLPAGLHLLAASRTQPAFNLSRLRVSGELLEIDADDLRLRAWEVERLFRDHYREPMAPEELAHLARWTEGWAAGLQLFHLATRGRPADERRRVLRSLGPRSRLAREYLAQNALDRVPEELRFFMVHTSVSSRLSGRICDRLLDRTGSADILDELERRCLFTTRVDDAGGYRYHEVFRSHLQGVLVNEVGDEGARARFLAAGDLLMQEGTAAEALEAYVRAEAWEIVEQVLSEEGPAIAEEPLHWLGVHAQEPIGHDPWLALAGARRLRAEGRFGEAAKAYGALAADSRTEAAAHAARRERAELLTWLHPEPGHRPGPEISCWTTLRRAVSDGPRPARQDLAGVATDVRLVTAICTLVEGDLLAAGEELARLEGEADAEGLIACVASLTRGSIALLGGDDDGLVVLNGAVGSAEGQSLDWLARVGRSMLALGGRIDHLHEAARLEDAARALGDRWGAALARATRAWGAFVASSDNDELGKRFDPATLAAQARRDFRALEAPVPEAWMAALLALAEATGGAQDAARTAREAEVLARSTGSRLPALLAQLAAAIERGDGQEAERLADLASASHGLRVPSITRRAPAAGRSGTARAVPAATPKGWPSPAPTPPARLQLFGSFRLEIGGEDIDVSAIRPRVRTLLYLLALDVGRPVHRETIMEALWPGSDPGAAARSLHVAVATLRRVLEPGASRGGFRLVPRDGEGYRLALPPGAHIDTVGFEEAVAAARAAAIRPDGDDVERWCRAALERCSGELIPEAGPSDWIAARRDVFRAEALEVATVLARALLDRGASAAAASVCVEGLGRDRYQDPLWRMLIEARDVSGDKAAANSARSDYQRTLAELGLAAPARGSV